MVLALRDAIHDPAVLANGGLVEDHFLRIIQARVSENYSRFLTESFSISNPFAESILELHLFSSPILTLYLLSFWVQEDDLASPFTPPTLSDLELYSEATSSRLFYLYLNLIGISSPILDEIFSHLGKANGLTLSLASLPFHAQLSTSPSHTQPTSGKPSPRNTITKGQRRLMIPSEYLFKHQVVEEEVYRKGMEAKGFKDSVFDTATRANDYLITARTMIKEEFGGKIPQAVVGPLIGAVSLSFYRMDRHLSSSI